MIISLLILIGSALLGGFISLRFSNVKKVNYTLVLAFSGAYLFSITILHILPELFITTTNISQTGIFVLFGFFLQQILEFFTAGAEHGHVHFAKHEHKHKGGMVVSLLVGLSVHSILEGSLLAHSESNLVYTSNLAIAIGIGMHKLPAAFAMMTILVCHYHSKTKPILFLILFALASPLGLIVSQYAIEIQFFSVEKTNMLFAIVGGGFLYISTTIVFESSKNHQVKLNKLIMLLLGASVAILAEKIM
jgi:zinc transporter ZupT